MGKQCVKAVGECAARIIPAGGQGLGNTIAVLVADDEQQVAVILRAGADGAFAVAVCKGKYVGYHPLRLQLQAQDVRLVADRHGVARAQGNGRIRCKLLTVARKGAEGGAEVGHGKGLGVGVKAD